MKLGISGIGVRGPGLVNWPSTAALLDDSRQYDDRVAVPTSAALLGSMHRRASTATRLAVGASFEAMAMSGSGQGKISTVFASANGSGAETVQILEGLSEPGMGVSPTKFHNSVHNAAVGYWCISMESRRPSTSIACHNFSFSAGLLKAAAQVVVEAEPVLFCAFDTAFPEPLNRARPVYGSVAVALVLVPSPDPALFNIDISVQWGGTSSFFEAPSLVKNLAEGNPAGPGLELLAAVARSQDRVLLRYLHGGHVRVILRCS